jgi:redox-sensitive bicupin YhaK (pirin superfamily)
MRLKSCEGSSDGRDKPMASARRIPARLRSVGPFSVRRLLPVPGCRKVGPWVFLDHFGPTEHTVGANLDSDAHPHSGLSTVTWLFEGAVVHRDSLGHEVGPSDPRWWPSWVAPPSAPRPTGGAASTGCARSR